MKLSISIITALLLSSQAFAMTRTIKGDPDGKKIDIARVQKQITLVQKRKGPSDLRVSLVVLDNGGSTDVSPRATLYLTMFNESEERGSSSAHRIAPINNVISHKRIKAGIYEVVASSYDIYGQCGEGLYMTDRITIDARDLSVAVRNFKGADEVFSYSVVQDNITVTTRTECNSTR